MIIKKLVVCFLLVFMIAFSCCSLVRENHKDKQPQTSHQIQKSRYGQTRLGVGDRIDSGIQYENNFLPDTESEKKIFSVIEEAEIGTSPRFKDIIRDDGRCLRLLTEAVGAVNVVEIGTSSGISGLWFTMVLRSTFGRLIIYESDKAKIKISRENFVKAGVDNLVTFIEGDTHETIKKHTESIDILFISADKEGYIDYINKLLPFVRPGGLVVASNANSLDGEIRDYIASVTSNPELDSIFYKNGTGFVITIKKRSPVPDYIQKMFRDLENKSGIITDRCSMSGEQAKVSEFQEDFKLDVIYIPTPQDIVDKMLEVANVKKKDILYDLGCGDGRIVVTAAKRYGCRAVGFDIDPKRVEESVENARENNVEKLVRIEKKDIFTLDLSRADVITLFLVPELNERLIPQLENLRPGTRIVSHQWDMKGIKPDKVLTIISVEDNDPHQIYLWTAPIHKENGD